MARQVVIGKLEDDTYTFIKENGEILASLKAGDRYYIQNNCYYEILKKDDKWYAQKWNKRAHKYIRQPLLDKMKVCLATSSESAQNSLYTFFKDVKEQDRLVDVLKKCGFIVQCIKKVETLKGIDIKVKAGYVEGCSNFSLDKNWYTYNFYTDSDSYDVFKTIPDSCANCIKKHKEEGKDFCTNVGSIKYVKFYTGSYFFVVRENVRTGKKEIVNLTTVKDVNRDKLADAIEKVI